MSSKTLRTLCMPCLNAFGLILDADSTSEPALTYLKNDACSVVVRARCNDGDTTREFVLKGVTAAFYRHNGAMNVIENLLAEENPHLVIPARRLTLSGRDVHIEVDGTAWTVTAFEANGPSFDWLQNPAPWTSSHTYSAGKLLAQFHEAASTMKPKILALNCEIEGSIIHSVPQLLLHAIENADVDFLATVGLETREYQRLIAIVCKASLELEDGIHAKALRAEEIIVHGDFQPGNVLYRDGKACGLVDWDYTRLDHPLMDLSYGLIMYASNLACEEATLFDMKRSRKFLQGYADHFAVKGGESVCMPDCFFSLYARDNRVFRSHMRISAALIMLWSLSDYGQKHPSGALVTRRLSQLLQEV